MSIGVVSRGVPRGCVQGCAGLGVSRGCTPPDPEADSPSPPVNRMTNRQV